MMDDFDWANDPSVAIPAQFAIAIHTNRDGNVVLRQEGDDVDGDQFVWIRPENVVQLAEAMLHEAGVEATVKPAPDEPLRLPKPERTSRAKLTGEPLPLPFDGAAS